MALKFRIFLLLNVIAFGVQAQVQLHLDSSADLELRKGRIKAVPVIIENGNATVALVKLKLNMGVLYQNNYALKAGEKRKCLVFFNPGEYPHNETLLLKAYGVDTVNGILELADSLSIHLKYEKFKENTSNKIVQFGYLIRDFGVIPEGEMVSTRFEFLNFGTDNISIVSVESSCGCLPVYYDTGGVSTGNVGYIDMEFYSENRPGFFQKTAVVQLSNGESFVLSVTGEVQPPQLYDAYR